MKLQRIRSRRVGLPTVFAAAAWAILPATPTVQAAVSAEEAAKLKTELTPLGAERAGNKEGSIPAWTGGYTTPVPGFVNGGRRPDPFANEKPLYTITAANMDPYASKLNDGTKALLKKYPQTFRVDVYKTHRTAAAPQWVYDSTAKNAVGASMNGEVVEGAYGGIPFPIPKTGREVVANHILSWRGTAWETEARGYLTTAEGQSVMTVQVNARYQMPYYLKDGADRFNGEYFFSRIVNAGPPVRAGEALLGRFQVDESKSQAWVYLTGQRRVRKLPNACCDTPSPATAGVMSFDEINVLLGRLDRFDFKIIGKQEMLIPYNSNRLHVPPKDADVLMPHHLNPDHVRWELHRVWVVEANLRAGQRHSAPRSRYYLDEDTWIAVLGDRWDGKGQLWKTLWQHPVVMPDVPATASLQESGFNDLLSGAWYITGVYNERSSQLKVVPPAKDAVFTPDALAGEGVR